MIGQEEDMAHLGNADLYNPVENDSADEKQYEGLIPPYIITGQLFPRRTA